jgi:hypothetical protein
MNVTAEVLRELHRIHRQLTDLRDRRDRGPKQVKAHEANVKRLDDELAKVKADSLNSRKNVDTKQLQLRSLEDKLNQLKNRLSQCSTNKEYQAIQEQMSADKVASSVLEDEILDALGKVDEYKPLIGKAEQNLAKGREEFEKVRKQVDEQRQVILGDITRLEADLRDAETRLPSDFRQGYDRIVKAKGEDALAEVDGDVCGGCYQQMTPNTLSQLRMGQAIFCKSCGRLLYLPEAPRAN